MPNRFEKNSRLTLFILLSLCSLVLFLGFEKLVGISLGHTEEQLRHIRLREHSPLLDKSMKPLPPNLKFTDSLEDKAFLFRTDEHGLIKPSFPHQNPDLTLAFIGGSTTECMFVAEDKRFPYVTGKRLSNENYKVNSINAGVSGNDSLNSLNIYLNKIIPLKPDIAIMMHNINDLSLLLFENSYWNDNPFRSPIIEEQRTFKDFVKAKLPNTYEFLFRIKANMKGNVDEFAEQRGKKSTIKTDQILTLFENNLKTFIEISKANGIKPVLMTMANRFTDTPDTIISDKIKNLESIGLDYVEYKKRFDMMNNHIRLIAKDNNVYLVDLAKTVPQTKKYMVDSVHFNDFGSEFVGNHIASHFKKLIAQ